MSTALRRLAPVAVLAVVASVALTFSADRSAQAAPGTTIYQAPGGDQPAYVFLDAQDTAGAGIDPLTNDTRQYDAGSVCDNTPELETLTHGNGDDAQLWYCGNLLNSCPTPAAGRLLGLTIAPGTDPAEVLAHSTCWTYPAEVSIQRTVPQVYVSSVTAQDPVFDVSVGRSADDPEWNLEIATPDGPKSGTQVRASAETVDGSVPVHALGVTQGSGGETGAASFAYQGWDGVTRWAEVGTDGQWIVVSLKDGLTMDPQICLDSGICQQTRTLEYVGWDGSRDSATILPHM